MKVGIIGTGAIAREHARAIAMVPASATLVAACDAAPAQLAAFAKDFGVANCHASHAALIADPQVDLVVVATPPAAHEEAVIAALEAGKYVLCEKPLAHSLASAQRIAAAAAKHPGKLSICHQLRYDPRYRRMLWLVANGWIGDVQEALVERHGYIWQSVAPGSTGWWGRWDVAGGGALMTQTIHELDIMLLAMGDARTVSAAMDTRFTQIESEDWIELEANFDGGRVARCSASVNSGQARGAFAIRGSKGSVMVGGISLDDPSQEARAIAAVNAALPDTRPAPISASLPVRVVRKVMRKLLGGPPAELTPHAQLYRAIAEAAAAGRALPISADEALKPMQLCAGAYEAAIIGSAVALPMGAQAATYDGVTPAAYAARPRPAEAARPVASLPKSSVVRIGLIGLDTTHATAFTELLHNPYAADHIPGGRVVAAFSGGSPDMAISATRVGGFTAELQGKYGVPILGSPEEVADACDVAFILSSDGRAHPGLFQSVAGRGKPVFIDKPFAVSARDAARIFALAAKTETQVFASSAFRYADGLVAAVRKIREAGEKVVSCEVRYWGQIQPTQGRYFWYGIHGAEMLLAVMGKGVKSASARCEGTRDIIEVEHHDGRRSVMIGDHNDGNFGVTIQTDRQTYEVSAGGALAPRILAAALDLLTPGGYPRLWQASSSGSVSGRAGKPLDPDQKETMEVIALLDAAQRSFAGTGEWIEIEGLEQL